MLVMITTFKFFLLLTSLYKNFYLILAFAVTSSNLSFRYIKTNFDPNSRHKKESVLEGLRPSLSYLNFGLDVVPSMKLKLPDIVIIKIVCVPFYIIFMMFWFPILPVIQ